MKPFNPFWVLLIVPWKPTDFMRSIFFILSFCFLQVAAQQIPVIKNLVFEGAGLRGLAYAGAIKELDKKDLLKNIQRVGGTSAGALTALLLSLGYTASELEEIVKSTPYHKLNDGRFFFIGGINRVKKYFGWYRGLKFEKWIRQLINEKTGDPDISFGELHRRGFKDLYITGTSLNRQKLVIFSYESSPEMKIKDAVQISVTIPFYFEPVFLTADGKVIHHPKNKKGLDVMVDGGIVANYPIRLFDSTKYWETSKANEFGFNPETLGFRIDRDDQIANDREGKGLANMPVTTLNTYISAFYNMVIENLNRQLLTNEDWRRTISISDGYVQPRIRKLSVDEVGVLLENGALATRMYFSTSSPQNN